MAVIKWNTPETIASYLTTQLNSLANNTFSSSGATIDNLTDLYLYINLELVLAAQGTARSAGAYVEVWMERTLDGTNYEDRANAAFTPALLTAFQLDAATMRAASSARHDLACSPAEASHRSCRD